MESDVLMFANHGIVLGAPEVESATALNDELEVRLQQPVRAAPAAQPAGLHVLCAQLAGLGLGWRRASHEE